MLHDWNGDGIEKLMVPIQEEVPERVLGLVLYVPWSLDTGHGNLGANAFRRLCQL